MLYDVGSAVSNVKAAESITAPALWSHGVERLDAVFISHPHFDHFKDILPLVDRFGLRQVFIPPTFMRNRLKVDNDLVEALQARGVEVICLSAGDRLAGAGPTELRAVWPRGPASQTRAINDGSLVLSVESEGRRLLLTGDLMPASMAALLAAEPDLRADAVLWPHHGHEPDSVGQFAAKVGPRVLVASAGRAFVAPPEPPWLKRLGIACYHTGECGAVTLEMRAAGLHVETFAEGPVPDEPEAETSSLAGEADD